MSYPDRIIVERLHDHWAAWFNDAPEFSYGGRRPVDAIDALLSAHSERGVVRGQVFALQEEVRVDHLEFLVSVAAERCPECKGSGRYVGLQAVETCQFCGGSGRSPEIPF